MQCADHALLQYMRSHKLHVHYQGRIKPPMPLTLSIVYCGHLDIIVMYIYLVS